MKGTRKYDSHKPDARKQSALDNVTEFKMLEDALEVIDECRKQFRKYKIQHIAKASFAKGTINRDFEKMCEKEIEKNRSFFNG